MTLMTSDGPCDLFGPVVAENSEVLGSNHQQGRMFVMKVAHIPFFKRFKGLECAVLSTYGTVHYKEPSKSSDKSRT